MSESIITSLIKLVQHERIKFMLESNFLSYPWLSEIEANDTECHAVIERWQIIPQPNARFNQFVSESFWNAHNYPHPPVASPYWMPRGWHRQQTVGHIPKFPFWLNPVLTLPLAKRPLPAMEADITRWWPVCQVWVNC